MDPHYNDSELWCFSDGTQELYIEIYILNLNYGAPQLNQVTFTELDNSTVQLCNWFLEIRNLRKSIAVFSSSINKSWSSKIGYVAPRNV